MDGNVESGLRPSSGFKKVYTHPLKRRPTSEQVAPEHLIVSDATKDLASCERITHVITMRQSVMKRYIAKGIYRRIDLMLSDVVMPGKLNGYALARLRMPGWGAYSSPQRASARFF